LFTFRYKPSGSADGEALDELNRNLVTAINDDGRIYLTQSVHDGIGVIRFMCGQFDMEAADIDVAFDVITEVARKL